MSEPQGGTCPGRVPPEQAPGMASAAADLAGIAGEGGVPGMAARLERMAGYYRSRAAGARYQPMRRAARGAR